MPIGSGARGRPGILAIPGRVTVGGDDGLTYQHSFGKKRFRSPPLSTSSVYIAGVTRDSAGVVIASATVQLFRTFDDSFQGEMVSDGSGAFSILAPGSGPFYLVAYKAGSPDVAGTTVNTLLPA